MELRGQAVSSSKMAALVTSSAGATPGEDSAHDGDLFDYAASLSDDRVAELFVCRWSCVGILRHLSPVAKQLCLRLLCVRKPVPKVWLNQSAVAGPQAKTALKDALEQLKKLRVLVDAEGEAGRVQLHKTFASQLRNSVTASKISELPWQDGIKVEESIGVDLTALQETALRKWTAILHFVVGSTEFGSPGSRVVKLLVSMGLMRYGSGPNDAGGPKITRQGYEFMLKDIHEQIWIFMKHYTTKVSSPQSVLQMLFRMSYCTPGTPCTSRALDATQKELLTDFNLFGLVQIDSRHPDRFFPTSLGVNVVFGQSREERMAAAAKAVDFPSSQGSMPGVADGSKKVKAEPGVAGGTAKTQDEMTANDVFIICETNFKVYAYTQSSLHIEMLRLFVKIECILPNLIVAIITRSSIRSAFKLGITGSQIIHFLTENAHPLCKKRHRLVPDNITDQIILWEGERNRVVAQRGMCYHDFMPEEASVYHAAVGLARDNKWLLFQASEPKMSLVIIESKHEEMRAFIKQTRERLRSG
mmetsp:Transcript_16514/g.26712  ORF Transcript_16514/g.26712 Transcript_16514/m.26712 type:complete len:529 (+) Transcript_16514:1-1587(+)